MYALTNSETGKLLRGDGAGRMHIYRTIEQAERAAKNWIPAAKVTKVKVYEVINASSN